jgi:hypothetical protein
LLLESFCLVENPPSLVIVAEVVVCVAQIASPADSLLEITTAVRELNPLLPEGESLLEVPRDQRKLTKITRTAGSESPIFVRNCGCKALFQCPDCVF